MRSLWRLPSSRGGVTGGRPLGSDLSISEMKARHVESSQSDNTMAMAEGTLRGVESVFRGVADGVVGLFSNPIAEIRREDATLGGVAEGTLRGAAGLFVKPLVGIGDGFKNVLEGVRDQAIGNDDIIQRRNDMIPRIRLPRCLYTEDRILRPYSDQDARIKILLEDMLGCTVPVLAMLFVSFPGGQGEEGIVITQSHIIWKLKVGYNGRGYGAMFRLSSVFLGGGP